MEKRTRVLVVILILIFAVFFIRLFQLQIIQGEEHRFQAENNRINKIKIEAPRGLITDRHGEILAENEPQYLLDKNDISREEALRVQSENKDSLLKIKLVRKYPGKEVFAHVVGYLGEVTDKEFKEEKMDLKGYLLGDFIGRAGIEAQYETQLRGREGNEMVEVDTQGNIIRRLGRILPTPGKTITLAIDKKLQETAAAAFGKLSAGASNQKKGAVIATNPQNGEVLLLFSSPSFDPNLFLSSKNSQQIGKLITDEVNQPLFNRTISGQFPPGSTFKIVTSTAGLEEKKITKSTLINDPGVLRVGDFTYANWYFTQYGRTEGEINVVKALSRSTDTFFYKLGEMVGIEKLNYWAEKFNVEKKSGIDLPGEVAGFMATPEWKQRVKKESWFLGNTYHIAIGQGDIAMTPLGVNLMTAAVANGGKICTPRMLRIGAENTPYQPDCPEIGVNKEYLEIIKEGMVGACSEGGTAYPFFDFKPQVACKTGTAEISDGKDTHAWFTVFAPAENPTIVLTVLVEQGGEGSTVAAPIAKEILDEYFKE